MNGTATGLNTKFNLLMDGVNNFSGNGLGPIGPLSFSNIEQAMIVLSGSFDNSPADGIRVDLTEDVNTGLVAVLGHGTISSSAQNGININMTNVNTGSVLIDRVTSIDSSGQDGIHVAFDDVTQGAIAIQGPTSIRNSGQSAIDVSLTNNTALVDGLSFGAANVSVLTLANNLPSPLNNQLPVPVTQTLIH